LTHLNTQQLYQIGDNVWNHLGSLHLANTSLLDAMRSELQCYVRVTVGSDGYAVLLGLNEDLAELIAAQMFNCSANSLRAEDIKDALGEVTNMLAGNIRVLIGEAGGLGLPEHITQASLPAYWREIQVDVEACGLSEGSPVYIAIIKKYKTPSDHKEI
jgi:hypothetical protein